MRLDKYLKVSRLIKRRTLAKEVCSQGRVTLNGQPAKASAIIQVGDEIGITFGRKQVTVRVTHVANAVRKEDADSMFETIHEQYRQEESGPR